MEQLGGGCSLSANCVPHCAQIKFSILAIFVAAIPLASCCLMGQAADRRKRLEIIGQKHRLPSACARQSFVRGKYLSELPDFMKRVVEWSGGDADDVWF